MGQSVTSKALRWCRLLEDPFFLLFFLLFCFLTIRKMRKYVQDVNNRVSIRLILTLSVYALRKNLVRKGLGWLFVVKEGELRS